MRKDIFLLLMTLCLNLFLPLSHLAADEGDDLSSPEAIRRSLQNRNDKAYEQDINRLAFQEILENPRYNNNPFGIFGFDDIQRQDKDKIPWEDISKIYTEQITEIDRALSEVIQQITAEQKRYYVYKLQYAPKKIKGQTIISDEIEKTEKNFAKLVKLHRDLKVRHRVLTSAHQVLDIFYNRPDIPYELYQARALENGFYLRNFKIEGPPFVNHMSEFMAGAFGATILEALFDPTKDLVHSMEEAAKGLLTWGQWGSYIVFSAGAAGTTKLTLALLKRYRPQWRNVAQFAPTIGMFGGAIINDIAFGILLSPKFDALWEENIRKDKDIFWSTFKKLSEEWALDTVTGSIVGLGLGVLTVGIAEKSATLILSSGGIVFKRIEVVSEAPVGVAQRFMKGKFEPWLLRNGFKIADSVAVQKGISKEVFKKVFTITAPLKFLFGKVHTAVVLFSMHYWSANVKDWANPKYYKWRLEHKKENYREIMASLSNQKDTKKLSINLYEVLEFYKTLIASHRRKEVEAQIELDIKIQELERRLQKASGWFRHLGIDGQNEEADYFHKEGDALTSWHPAVGTPEFKVEKVEWMNKFFFGDALDPLVPAVVLPNLEHIDKKNKNWKQDLSKDLMRNLRKAVYKNEIETYLEHLEASATLELEEEYKDYYTRLLRIYNILDNYDDDQPIMKYANEAAEFFKYEFIKFLRLKTPIAKIVEKQDRYISDTTELEKRELAVRIKQRVDELDLSKPSLVEGKKLASIVYQDIPEFIKVHDREKISCRLEKITASLWKTKDKATPRFEDDDSSMSKAALEANIDMFLDLYGITTEDKLKEKLFGFIFLRDKLDGYIKKRGGKIGVEDGATIVNLVSKVISSPENIQVIQDLGLTIEDIRACHDVVRYFKAITPNEMASLIEEYNAAQELGLDRIFTYYDNMVDFCGYEDDFNLKVLALLGEYVKNAYQYKLELIAYKRAMKKTQEALNPFAH